MQAEIHSFLLGVGRDELIRREVLRKGEEFLVQKSIPLLIDLMRDRGVDRLVSNGPWFLDVSGECHNPKNERLLFDNQNDMLNPFFESRAQR